MSGEPFTLDTNVLVYSVDRAAGHRHDIAKDIMTRSAVAGCCLTLQAISEFFRVAARKSIMPRGDAVRVAEAMLDLYRTATASRSAIRAALAGANAGQAAYWDALLVATAAEAGCAAILTEDLADGATLHGVRIINPFNARNRPAIDALLAPD